jgi:chemotaxis signal transduction protein
VGKYLIFSLGDAQLGLQIQGVEDIVALKQEEEQVHFVRRANGQAVPVVDLRRLVPAPRQANHERYCVVVVEALYRCRRLVLGFVVERMAEILEIATEELETVGGALSGLSRGILRFEHKTIELLDLGKVTAEVLMGGPASEQVALGCAGERTRT